MLKHWLTGIRNKDKKLIFVGVVAIMWAIWCTRNDLIFQKKNSFFYAGYIGCGFGPYRSVRTKERSSVRRAKH
jgi:hypothetical protein